MVSLVTKDWTIEDIETVLFDKDGTFIDLHYFWGKMTELRAIEVIKRFGLADSYFEQICLYLGYDVKSGLMLSDGITALYSRSKIIEIFRGNLLDFGVETTVDILAGIFDKVSAEFYENMQEYTKPISEAIEFIKFLKFQGLKLGVVTSDSVESAKLTIKYNDWDDLFDVVIGRESCEYTKESGEPTKLALKLLNANPKTTVMVGDAPMDFISAQNAGLKATILVASGQIGVSELCETSDFVVGSLNEVSIN